MSEDKEKRIHANEESGEEVEAHVRRGGRDAMDEGTDEQDEVEAHVRRGGRDALNEGTDDDSDDVQAHVKSYKN